MFTYRMKIAMAMLCLPLFCVAQSAKEKQSPSKNLVVKKGKVGIGTDEPQKTLDVAGDINFSGELYKNGQLFTGGDKNNPPPIALDDLTDALNDGFTIAIGNGAGSNDNGGNGNIFIGNNAGQSNSIGGNNTVLGYAAFQNNKTGGSNVAIGDHTLFSNKVGIGNTAVGMQSMFNNFNGSYNTALGSGSLYNNIDGVTNTAIGLTALTSNTTGSLNTAIGGNSLYENVNGESNTGIGNAALYRNKGSYNTATGSIALFQNTNGEFNTATGYQALYDNRTGNKCTAIGYSANSIGQVFNNTTGLGYDADCTASNQVRIGNAAVASIGGFVNWTNVSDARFKTNVQENVKGLDFIMALRPVTYTLSQKAIKKWKEDKYGEKEESKQDFTTENSQQTGFIAQEVEAVAKEVGYEFSGVDTPKNDKDFYGLRYAEFVVPLVKAMQEQQQLIEELQAKIEVLEAKK